MNFVVGQRVRVKTEDLLFEPTVPNPCFGHIEHIREDSIRVNIFQPIGDTVTMDFEIPWDKPFLEAVD